MYFYILIIVSVISNNLLLENEEFKMKEITSIEELNEMCKTIKEKQEMEEKVHAEMEQMKELVKAYMDKQSQEEISTDDYKVIWKMVNRKDVDRKKLEADGLLEKYLKYSDYPQLRINSKKK